MSWKSWKLKKKKYPVMSLNKVICLEINEILLNYWQICKNPKCYHIKSLKWTHENVSFIVMCSKIFRCDHTCMVVSSAVLIVQKCVTCTLLCRIFLKIYSNLRQNVSLAWNDKMIFYPARQVLILKWEFSPFSLCFQCSNFYNVANFASLQINKVFMEIKNTFKKHQPWEKLILWHLIINFVRIIA